ncbi:MAG: hypothetical protein O6940_13720 [Ignavibacteria bacterium]|nr:hypothetical protein [Ignavibacteria bacterium]
MKYYTNIFFVTVLIITYFLVSSNMKDNQFPNSLKIRYVKSVPGPDSRPYEWAYLQRVFPHMKSSPNAYIDALERAHLLQREAKANRLAKGESLVQWEFAGPINVGGRVVDLEINPFNPNIIYSAFATGGVFKSTDMGANWFSIFDSLNVLTIGDIAIDPINTDIIYVGTGEANGGHNNFPGGGVFKSTDAGNT